MPTSRFDSPAQYSAMNTFVANPIPFQELMQAGAYRTQQHEQGLARLNQGYETVYNTKYNPNTRDRDIVKREVDKAREIVDKYTKSGQDLGDPVARQQLIRDFNTDINHDHLRNVEATAENAAKYDKTKSEMQARGEIAHYDTKPAYLGWDSSTGVFNEQPRYYNKNYDKDIKTNFIDKIPDTILKHYYAKDADGNTTNTMVTVKGTDLKQIDKYLMPDGKNIDPTIATDPDVQTMLRDIKSNAGMDPYTPTKYDNELIKQGLHERAGYKIHDEENDHNLAEPKEGKDRNLFGGPLSALLPERTSSATPIPGSDNFYDNHKKVIDEVNKLGKNAPKDKVEEANTYKRKLDETNKLVLNNHKDEFVQLSNEYKDELKKKGFTPQQAEDMFKKMTQPVNGDSRDIRHYTGEALRQNINNFFIGTAERFC